MNDSQKAMVRLFENLIKGIEENPKFDMRDPEKRRIALKGLRGNIEAIKRAAKKETS